MNTKWGKDSLFNKWCSETWIISYRPIKLGLCFTPLTNVNSKWIEDLYIKNGNCKTPRRKLKEKSP